MAEHTNISWADDTFNPWEGCQKVSPACDGCYAEARNLRYAPKGAETAPNWGPGALRRRTSASNWAKPLKWELEQQKALDAWHHRFSSGLNPGLKPPPRFVLCASLADVFDNAVPMEWRRDLFDLIRKTPHLTWLLLTKRPGNIVKLFQEAMRLGEDADDFNEFVDGNWAVLWPRNAALLTTCEDQPRADQNIPKLLAAAAVLRPAFTGVSMEPLLGSVDIRQWIHDYGCGCGWGGDPLSYCQECGWRGRDAYYGDACPNCAEVLADYVACPECDGHDGDGDSFGPNTKFLDWVITGGETDQGAHKARPSNPQWFRDIGAQCAAAGVSWHHKQNGEWVSVSEVEGPQTAFHTFDDDRTVRRVGKARAGRTIDGVIHDARPQVAA